MDSCDAMAYVEDGEYWDQALSRTEHFLFHKVQRLRPPPNGGTIHDDNVFSLSACGTRLTQRTFMETGARYSSSCVCLFRQDRVF